MENLHAILIEYWNQFVMGLLGLAGSIVDILLYQTHLNESGKKMPVSLIYATLISGPVLALTASTLIGSYMGLDVTKSGVLGLCAYLTGMTARRVSGLVFATDINLPWGKK